MKKTIYFIVLAMLCLNFWARGQTRPILRVTIQNSSRQPLNSASIKIKESGFTAKTNQNGEFQLTNIPAKGTLIITHMGYKSEQYDYDVNANPVAIITMTAQEKTLEEINIVSTGYQIIPKERATGAFSSVNEKTLNRNTGVNILDRLEGVASGVLYNRGLATNSNNSKLQVRGRSTIFANAEPLIVLNGLPYEGTIDQINPADITTIDILKDAAAASIWGTRASNGVIVINTKTGKLNQPTTFSIGSTLSVSGKPDLYYLPQISPSDFIDLEAFLYAKGYYNGILNQKFAPVSPAIEIFNNRKNNLIIPGDSATLIEKLKSQDVRRDLGKYAYRNKIYQQYQINLSGGSTNQRYYVSAGYDRNLESRISSKYDRVVLTANHTYLLLKNRVELSTDVGFNASARESNDDDNTRPYSPYESWMDASGTALSTVRNLRQAYIDTAGKGKLLDWNYRPLDELSSNSFTTTTQYRLKLGTKFKITDHLDLTGNYQYLNEIQQLKIEKTLDSYFARDMINRFSSLTGNTLTRAVPMGDMVTLGKQDNASKVFRIQANYQRLLHTAHEVNAILGYESNYGILKSNSQPLFGYNSETKTNGNGSINPLSFYPLFGQPGATAQINTSPTLMEYVNFSQSYYSNLSYGYKGKYILSGSVRRDESNLFGVKPNQKGVPLWSAGLAWIINKEKFYQINWLTSLKMRATYGYNGNVDKSTSAYLTVQALGLNNPWGSPYSSILNPPNPALRWEKVKTWNLGIDFQIAGNIISGSLDVYKKQASDLIGNSPISMQTGVAQFKGNSANVLTKGIDIVLHSRNLDGEIKWGTDILFNYNNDRITKYLVKQTSNLNIVSANYQNPLEGYPYYSIFSFPSAGLNEKGAAQGYLNGNVSTDYAKIIQSLDPHQLKYNGTATPKYFGSLINRISYGPVEVSFNISYKFGYVFRRYGVFTGLHSANWYNMAGYENRWQNPGDELNTKIPALKYPINGSEGSFFQYSEDLVAPGDHIRLQDIRIDFSLPHHLLNGKSIKRLTFFAYARNLGIIWRKNTIGIDPDYGTLNIPEPRLFSLGFNLTL
jgi:TonB-linked SusC/RagA family outer membrane protein